MPVYRQGRLTRILGTDHQLGFTQIVQMDGGVPRLGHIGPDHGGRKVDKKVSWWGEVREDR